MESSSLNVMFGILTILELFVTTSPQTAIRLAGGSDKCRGRLEIQTGPSDSNDYHPVCSSIAQDNEAKVICRMIPGCPSELARRVSLNEFAESGDTNSTSYPFKYVCNGNEGDYFSCHLTKGKVCRQRSDSDVNQIDIAIECDTRRDVNVLLVVIVGVIVVTFISLPIITYSCIKCFEWIDNH